MDLPRKTAVEEALESLAESRKEMLLKYSGVSLLTAINSITQESQKPTDTDVQEQDYQQMITKASKLKLA